MEKERSKIETNSTEDEKNLLKVLQPEGELEIPFKDGSKKIYWAKQGFGSKALVESYLRAKIREAIDSKLLDEKYLEKEPGGLVDGENTIFTVPTGIISKSLQVFIKGTLLVGDRDYTHNSDGGVLFFKNAPKHKLYIKCRCYDQDTYEQIISIARTIMMIYLACREVDDHNKKIFSTPMEVECLNELQIGGILNKYFEKLAVAEKDLKKSPATPHSEEDLDMQKDSHLTPLEEQSGEVK